MKYVTKRYVLLCLTGVVLYRNLVHHFRLVMWEQNETDLDGETYPRYNVRNTHLLVKDDGNNNTKSDYNGSESHTVCPVNFTFIEDVNHKNNSYNVNDSFPK